MSLQEYFIGIDGGGTKTTCVIGTSEGKILTMAKGKASNIQSKSLHDVTNVLIGLMKEVMQRTNSDFTQVRMVYMSLAGTARASDKEKIISALRSQIPEQHVGLVIENDAKAALASGSWGETGLVLIAGTGSIAYAFPSSKEAPTRVGGWGYLLGDEGSGFDIGKKGITAVLQEYDGRGSKTEMTPLLLKQLKQDNPGEIIPAVYGNNDVRSKIASLSNIVFQAAEHQDVLAIEIVDEAIEHLILLVEGAYESLPHQAASTSLVVSGGLFQNTTFQKKFDETIRQRTKELTPIYPTLSPVVGSYILALKQTDVNMTKKMQATIENSWAGFSQGGISVHGTQ